MPERRIENAMMKRGKLVTMIRMPGAIDKIVNSPKVRMIQAATDPFTGTFRRSVGSCCGNCCAIASSGENAANTNIIKASNNRDHSITKVLNITSFDTRPSERRSTRS